MQQCVAHKHWRHACQARVHRKQVVTRASSLDSSLFKLPLFSSRNALLPTEAGRLHVYEPRYLEMFKKLQDEAQGVRPDSLRFGHIISAQEAPPLLLEEASIAGVPKVGVIANVRGVQALEDGTLEVEYEGSRRFQILSMVEQEPYMVAYVMSISDTTAPATPEQHACDAAELELYNSLQEVVRLSNQIAAEAGEGAGGGQLPAAVSKYAPVPVAPRRTLAQALIDSGYSAAGHSMALWQAQGSVYGKPQRQGRQEFDPYTLAAGQILGHELRQELFSFAAAGVIDMGPPERLAILNSRDTLGRLQWLIKAVSPYLQELRAKAALSRALGTAAVDMEGSASKPE